jgi:hypothetical protein
MSDPYRHPAGRSCATTATLLTAIAAMLAVLVRKGSAR